jgi:hypothetical protein
MFVGHYGVSFALKTMDERIPLWVLFIAVQLLDVVWAPLILLGIERALDALETAAAAKVYPHPDYEVL